MSPKKRIGEVLIEAGLIDIYQLQSALAHQKQWGGRIGEILVKLGFITEEELLSFLSKNFNLPYVRLKKVLPSVSAINFLPEELAIKYNVLPILLKEELGRKTLYLAMSDPTNLIAIDELKFAVSCNIKPVVSSAVTISEAINFYYQRKGAFKPEADAQMAKDVDFDQLIIKKHVKKKTKPEPTTEQTEDDTLYIFTGGQETTLSLEEDNNDVQSVKSKEVITEKKETQTNKEIISNLQLYSMMLDIDAKISSLVKLLLEKRIITKEDYLERYHKEQKKKGNK